MHDDPRFDDQRQSPLAPEARIEAAGHIARGLGAERIRRLIVAAMVAFGVIVAVVIVAQF